MINLFLLSLLLVVASAGNTKDLFKETSHGEGTYYGGNEKGGNCVIYPLPSWANRLLKVAINDEDYNESETCGMCIEITGTGVGLGGDPITGTQIALVNDRCPECAKGDIDFGKQGDGRWEISWKAIDCPTDDDITFDWENSHTYFMKLQARGHKIPLASMHVRKSEDDDWEEAARTSDNYFSCYGCSIFPLGESDLYVKLTAINGEVVYDKVPFKSDGAVTGYRGVQFEGMDGPEAMFTSQGFSVPGGGLNLNAISGLLGNTLDRYEEMMQALSSDLGNKGTVILSSGGVAGGVVSEGQGYGLFVAANAAASVGPRHKKFNQIINKAYSIFKGWQTMCVQSKEGANCQSTHYCTKGGSKYPCLPHWKWEGDLSRAGSTGAAPDGDEDAILGMIILVRATEKNKPDWWGEVARWTYESSKQFYESSTTSQGGNGRIVKLGSCWGGWSQNNPSYHAPGAYRAMRDFMEQYGPALGMGSEGQKYVAKWNDVISTTYKVLFANQCPQTGLVTNWYEPDTDTIGFSGSGTPAAEYGSEASRTVWRVALDYLWYGDESSDPAKFLTPIAKQIAKKFTGNGFGNLDTGCHVKSIHVGWTDNAFMFAPTFTALVILRDSNPLPSNLSIKQGDIITQASKMFKGQSIRDYYSGSWIAIGTPTLNGDLLKLKSLMRGGGTPSPIPSPRPNNPPPRPNNPPSRPNPPPRPNNPPPRPSGGGGKCSGATFSKGNPYWFAIDADSSLDSLVAHCRDGKKVTCTFENWGMWTCSGSGPKGCEAPKLSINGAAPCAINAKTLNAEETEVLEEGEDDYEDDGEDDYDDGEDDYADDDDSEDDFEDDEDDEDDEDYSEDDDELNAVDGEDVDETDVGADEDESVPAYGIALIAIGSLLVIMAAALVILQITKKPATERY